MTFVVLGIITSIAIPAFSRWLPKYRLKNAVSDFYSDMHLAKIEAIKANTNWAIVFDTDTSPGRYFICTDKGNNDIWDGPPENGGDDVAVKNVSLFQHKSGVDFGNGNATQPFDATPFGTGVTFTGNTVVFTSGGMLKDANDEGYVYLQNANGDVFVIGALANGFILMKKWNDGAWE